MILFPAIDLKDGRCVRLFKGRFEDQTVYSDDPAAMAERWAAEGAEWIHLVDLDASIGDNQANRQVIGEIRNRVPVKLQLGGGIRDLETAQKWFDLGLDRLIMGTVVCENPKIVKEVAQKYPGRVAVALDAVGSEIRVRGWLESGGQDLFDTAGKMKDLGVAAIIYTDVERDGTQEGPNLENTRKVAEISGLPTIASGGIAALSDLSALKPLASSGVIGAISGKALYSGSLDFAAGQRFLSAGE